jgi:integrase/recombinase XerD
MFSQHQQFIKERTYLHNVSPATVDWYLQSLAWLRTETPTESDLKSIVIAMREKGLKATGCNCRIRAINAYLKWSGSALRIPKMKQPSAVLPTFTTSQVKMLTQWKPKGFYQRRLHIALLVLFDTGCRITEALTLHVSDIDMDNLLILVDGKGRKQRRVPFSLELRKHLYKFVAEFGRKPHGLLLATRDEAQLQRRVVLRDVKLLCGRLGFEPPVRTLHSVRHTFAVNYLRAGGSVFHLQKVLGHSSLDMTRQYANLMTEDLQAVHQKCSLLAA